MSSQKKRSWRAVRDDCDDTFSRIVRKRAGRCVNCGDTYFLQCAHGFSRSYYAIRWDFRNAFCLCRACHVKYTHRPIEWSAWRKERWGADLEAELRALALTHIRPDVFVMLPNLRELEKEAA